MYSQRYMYRQIYKQILVLYSYSFSSNFYPKQNTHFGESSHSNNLGHWTPYSYSASVRHLFLFWYCINVLFLSAFQSIQRWICGKRDCVCVCRVSLSATYVSSVVTWFSLGTDIILLAELDKIDSKQTVCPFCVSVSSGQKYYYYV